MDEQKMIADNRKKRSNLLIWFAVIVATVIGVLIGMFGRDALENAAWPMLLFLEQHKLSAASGIVAVCGTSATVTIVGSLIWTIRDSVRGYRQQDYRVFVTILVGLVFLLGGLLPSIAMTKPGLGWLEHRLELVKRDAYYAMEQVVADGEFTDETCSLLNQLDKEYYSEVEGIVLPVKITVSELDEWKERGVMCRYNYGDTSDYNHIEYGLKLIIDSSRVELVFGDFLEVPLNGTEFSEYGENTRIYCATDDAAAYTNAILDIDGQRTWALIYPGLYGK